MKLIERHKFEYREPNFVDFVAHIISSRFHPTDFFHSSFNVPALSGRLLLMRHSRLRGHRILSSHPLLRLHVLLIGYLLMLFRGDVIGVHARVATRHSGLRCRDLWVADVFRRVYGGIPVDAVLRAWRRFGRIQTRLREGGKEY